MIACFFSAVRSTWSLPSDAACQASIAHCARSGSPPLHPISAGRAQGSTQYFNPPACAAQTPANASKTGDSKPGDRRDSEGNLLPTRFVNGVVTIPKTAPPEFEISGRVLTADGRGLRNATVLLLDSSGNVRIATTSSFGFYMFNDIDDAGSYTLSVESKRYHFESTLRVYQIGRAH